MEAFSLMEENKGEAYLHRYHLGDAGAQQKATAHEGRQSTCESAHVLQKNMNPAVYADLPLISLQNSWQHFYQHWHADNNTTFTKYSQPDLSIYRWSLCKNCGCNTVKHLFLLSFHLYVLHFFMFCLSLRLAVFAGQVTHPCTLSDESDPVGFGFAYGVLGIALDCQDTFIATRKYISYLNYEINCHTAKM